MRIFVTGATGFIGSAVVSELINAGHQVLGLARSDGGAAGLIQTGAQVHRGDLSNPDSLAAGARACDGVAHLAFNHEFGATSRETAGDMDLRAVRAMIAVMEGSNKPLVVTTGTLLIASDRVITEVDAPLDPGAPRNATETAALAAAGRGVRTSVMRLPPTVHGAGDHGFVPALIAAARQTGAAAYVGDGANRWPAVHRLDAAHLYRLALERAAPGTRLHAVAEEGIPMREISEAIGAGLGLPVRSVSADEAAAQLTWIAPFVAIDNPTSSAQTREMLGWNPEGPTLLADMKENGYFAS